MIASPGDVAGTLPLVHNVCTILKLHGDYVDARTMNTVQELAEYDEAMKGLLRQILTEYGLVVCGWSGEWDPALIAALNETRSPWFSTFWTSPRQPRAAAQGLIQNRDAKLIEGMDADAFFERLAESVDALEDLSAPENITAAIAGAMTKRYVDDSRFRIRLHDLVVGQANRIRQIIDDHSTEWYLVEPTPESIRAQLHAYETQTHVLRVVIAASCYWGTAAHERNSVSVLERVAAYQDQVQGEHYKVWRDLRRYPALITLYTGGLAAVAAENYSTLRAILYDPVLADQIKGTQNSLLLHVSPSQIGRHASAVLAPNDSRQVALLFHLATHESLWESIRDHFSTDQAFKAAYDRFEYLLGLARYDIDSRKFADGWGPPGVVAYRQHGYAAEHFLAQINEEISAQGEQWAPIRAGMFGGSLDRLMQVKESYDGGFERRGLV